MNKSEIEVGAYYTLRHHDGSIITVRLERKFGHKYSTTKWSLPSPRREYYECTNLKTGRSITVKSAAKFRERVSVGPVALPPVPVRDHIGMRSAFDAVVVSHGSISIIAPLCATLLAHLREHVGEEASWWGHPDTLDGTSGLVVEPRYVADLVYGLRAEGFTVG